MKWVVLRYRNGMKWNNEQSHAFFDINRLKEIMERYNIHEKDVKSLHVDDVLVDIKEVLESV